MFLWKILVFRREHHKEVDLITQERRKYKPEQAKAAITQQNIEYALKKYTKKNLQEKIKFLILVLLSKYITQNLAKEIQELVNDPTKSLAWVTKRNYLPSTQES